MGYAGGTTPSPTYRQMGDHTECVQIDYDPRLVSYGALLDEFFKMHDATRPAHSVQYASLILASDEGQDSEARAAIERWGSVTGRPIRTTLRRLAEFFPAEDYHQKYYLRQNRERMAEFRVMSGGDEIAFRESTEAARANGLALLR